MARAVCAFLLDSTKMEPWELLNTCLENNGCQLIANCPISKHAYTARGGEFNNGHSPSKQAEPLKTLLLKNKGRHLRFGEVERLLRVPTHDTVCDWVVLSVCRLAEGRQTEDTR